MSTYQALTRKGQGEGRITVYKILRIKLTLSRTEISYLVSWKTWLREILIKFWAKRIILIKTKESPSTSKLLKWSRRAKQDQFSNQEPLLAKLMQNQNEKQWLIRLNWEKIRLAKSEGGMEFRSSFYQNELAENSSSALKVSIFHTMISSVLVKYRCKAS